MSINGSFERTAVETVAGGGLPGYRDGLASEARFYSPSGIALSRDGVIYVADSGNLKIRAILPEGVVSTLAGDHRGYKDGEGWEAQFGRPVELCLYSDGSLLVVDNYLDRIRRVSPDGTVSTFAGAGGYTISFGAEIVVKDVRGEHRLPRNDGNWSYGLWSVVDGGPREALFATPSGIAVDSVGNAYVTEPTLGWIRRISPDGAVSTLAATGLPSEGPPTGDLANCRVDAKFESSTGIAVGPDDCLYITDNRNGLIRRLDTKGKVNTFAGGFDRPCALAFDSRGNLFVADAGKHQILMVSPQGHVAKVAGSTCGFTDGPGNLARFHTPVGIAVDVHDTLFVVDAGNNCVRRIVPRPDSATLPAVVEREPALPHRLTDWNDIIDKTITAVEMDWGLKLYFSDSMIEIDAPGSQGGIDVLDENAEPYDLTKLYGRSITKVEAKVHDGTTRELWLTQDNGTVFWIQDVLYESLEVM